MKAKVYKYCNLWWVCWPCDSGGTFYQFGVSVSSLIEDLRTDGPLWIARSWNGPGLGGRP